MATDLDGTFWDASFIPPPAHVAAVEELMQRGVTVLAATSRRPRHVRPRLRDAGLALPAVLIDGSVGVDFRTDERFHQACFDPSAAHETLRIFRAHGLDPCVYVEHPEFDIVVSGAPSTCGAHLARLGTDAITGDLETTTATAPVYAFSVLGLRHERLRPVLDELDQMPEASAVLYPEPVYGDYGLIVNPPGITKWSGIVAYCRLHGIEANEVMAVGDGLNDIPMLEHAGVAVAVRGGAPGALAISHHVIAPPSFDGWVEIVDLVGQY